MITTSSPYWPFILPLETGEQPQAYRFGFNGMEKDPEITGQEGSHYTAAFWEYDTRIARRWNVDPVVKPWESPYAAFANNPILFPDLMGADTVNSNDLNMGEYKVGEDIVKLPEVEIKGWETEGFSGTDLHPEESGINTVTPPKELPNWAKGIKRLAKAMEYMPYLSYVKNLVDIADDNSLGNYPNPFSYIPVVPNGESKLIDNVMDYTINVATDELFDAYNEDLIYGLEHGTMNALKEIEDYRRFRQFVGKHNEGLGSTDGRNIIVMYTDVDVEVDSWVSWKAAVFPTYNPRPLIEIRYGVHYDGWRPKYAIWGFESDYDYTNGTGFKVNGVFKLDYDE
jgi:hypothetical protein